MKRRDFITSTGIIALGYKRSTAADPCKVLSEEKTHILTLSFDDGFKRSFYRTAEIHEEYGLKACLNVVAIGNPPGSITEKWISADLVGNFDDWNKLKDRGHEVMPHSWEHINLTEVPLAEAKENIEKCLEYFEKNLIGYNPAEAVYNFAYNSSNQELDDYALRKVRAIRTGGWSVLKNTKYNELPGYFSQRRLGCWSYGPQNCDSYVEAEVNEFLSGIGGWLILNLHGLDNEGWGPISTKYLDVLLKRLVNIENLAILPTGKALNNQ
jgi:peptidoglycan/xylan/chitin deacetylase (PgdA/CDA1 family)